MHIIRSKLTLSMFSGLVERSLKILLAIIAPFELTTAIPSGIVLKICSIRFLFYNELQQVHLTD